MMLNTDIHLTDMHCETWKYYQSTSEAHAKVLQNLMVFCGM